jgi:hypothetical protein
MSKHKLSGYNPAPPPTGNTVPYSLYVSASDKYEIWAVPAAGGTDWINGVCSVDNTPGPTNGDVTIYWPVQATALP